MARKTIMTLTDDLDGSEAERTLIFSLDGTSYEIDLSRGNIDALTTTLGPFIAAGHKVGRRPNTRASSGGVNLAEVRTWAREQGMEVAVRGRVSKQILQAYTKR